ncbi:hypothetical protein L9F63_021046 [Diploptera punctata]|uniref:BRCT domain-containing protein n=1 Tax=Diploptera punctata TaxID=6984 RepID=A0AAD7ZPM7_DIPPU|nr:hypothetical protein L9F63_021046 [Diploptera punctata]
MDTEKANSTKKLGRFVIKDEDENGTGISAGSLFAHRKDSDSDSVSNVNVSNKNNTVQEASQQIGLQSVDYLKKLNGTKMKQTGSTKVELNGVNVPAKQKGNTPSKRSKEKEKQPLKKPKLIGKPFDHLLEDVVLVISGYQNPLRSNLRTMALEMGARYRSDWDSSCTHLICAFTNTPKFQQVWGKGHIVRKEWVENCHSKRKRLPWRRYALDKRDLSKPESEDEIPELVEDFSLSPGQSSDSDTEDEIERIRNRNACGDETDPDTETELPDTSNIPLPHLPSIFSGKRFYLSDKLCQETKHKVNRYIVALDGLLLEESEDDRVDIVISETKFKSKHLVVRPEWIFE